MVELKEQVYKIVVYYGNFIDTPKLGALRVRESCALGVSFASDKDSGTIVFIKEGSKDPLKDALEYDPSVTLRDIKVFDLTDPTGQRFMFPGFIDTHIHSSQYPNCGIFGNSTLLDWLETYTFPLEASLNDLEIANTVYSKVIERTLKCGTTTAVYYTTIDTESAKLMGTLCSKLGQRALVGKVCMDQNGPEYYVESTKDSLDGCKDMVSFFENDLNDDKVLPILTPRFAPTCSRELLHDLGTLASQKDLHVQTHLSENTAEISWVKSLFPECSSYTDVYNQAGLLSRKTVLAHCIHLSEDEEDLIKTTGSGISHCPVSNSSLTSGECRVRHLLEKDISIGLGSDVSGGYSPSILVAARHAHLTSRHLAMKCSNEKEKDNTKLSVAECLYLGTMGGASVIDLQDRIGSFEVGKQFDAQLINLSTADSNVDIFEWQRLGDLRKFNNITQPPKINIDGIISKWFFNGDDRNVQCTWVAGHMVNSRQELF
ncbi:putative guanine deaminase [Nakaseomyces bracarensis]|uniref:Guanine deaminase n=1 Tax=Nakaseomyces bracarensis TaxID=273131 RepID=A0ABR4NN85_9SACH